MFTPNPMRRRKRALSGWFTVAPPRFKVEHGTTFWSWHSASRRHCCCQSCRSVMRDGELHLWASPERLLWSKLPPRARTQPDMVRRRRLCRLMLLGDWVGWAAAVTTGVPAEVAAVQSAARTAPISLRVLGASDRRDRISAFDWFLSGRDCPATFRTEFNIKDSYWPLPRGQRTTDSVVTVSVSATPRPPAAGGALHTHSYSQDLDLLIRTAPPTGLSCLLMKCSVTLVTCGI